MQTQRKSLVKKNKRLYNNCSYSWVYAHTDHEVNVMEISYKKLWKLLIDKDMKKKDLQMAAGISWASVTKLSKGEAVSMDVLIKVCKTMECNIGDIMDLIPKDKLNA